MSDLSANPVDHDVHESVYDGLLVDDDRWAFGAGPDIEQGVEPLAGLDTSVPDGVDGPDLAAYSLMLGDDALVLAQRLSEWCSNAPDLEEDIALANIALDLLGQARLLLARAAAADPGCVPALPEGSPAPAEDRLAYFRDAALFRNHRLVEMPNGDFGETIARLVVWSTWRHALLEALRGSTDPVLAAVADKGVKESAYHRDFAGRWFLVLAQGTEESRRRVVDGLLRVWPARADLFRTHPVEARLAEQGVAVDPAGLLAEVDTVLDQVLEASGVERPETAPWSGVSGRYGRDGMHSEALGRMLAEMQSVARAHPTGRW